ncbi:hypothetical protein DSCW_25760 [Desulfosarcina widdelii]|uniref:Uncharacterized protein n=1 Tax=Desulfosarcina widdelii TaxID=947919 RepID=A0A5K7Z4H3_9BACT|nr:hypothetical protein [Desulfosarcina widdelii]BBO75159.1 hypothetical protein DSCW_25760 [Desulfosarcina widdelii]
MKRPIARFKMVCGWVLILLLTAAGQGGCDTGSEGNILPCIPDLQHAQDALAQRRGARFIAFLQKTGDKYIRNGDYECLYAMVKFFDDGSLTTRETRYLLLYRIVAQMGRKQFVGAHIDYDWLINMPGLGNDPDFDRLMESLIGKICAPEVDFFKQKFGWLHTVHAGGLHSDAQPKEENLASFLLNFSSERLLAWDFLTLKRCFESVDPRRLSPEEQRILYSTRLTVNLHLSRITDAYRAWMAYRDLAKSYPWAADGPKPLDMTFGDICAGGVGSCGAGDLLGSSDDDPKIRVFGAITHLETNAVGGRECMGGWVCVKAALEHIVAPQDVFKKAPEEKMRELFYLAKANMILGDYSLAHSQLLALKTAPGIAKTPFEAQIVQMIDVCATTIRKSWEASLGDKLKDLFELFFYKALGRFMLMAVLTLLLALFFHRWSTIFSEGRTITASFFKVLDKLPLRLPSLSLSFSSDGWLGTRFGKQCNSVLKGSQVFCQQLRQLYLELKESAGGLRLFSCNTFDPKEVSFDPGESFWALPMNYPGIDQKIRFRSRLVAKQMSYYAPMPICLISRIPGYRPNRYLWFYMCIGAVLSLLIARVLSLSSPGPTREHVIFFFLMTATLVASLTGIRIMSRKVLYSLEEIGTMLGSVTTLKRLRRQIRIMFRSPWQLFVAFVLYGFFFIVSKNQLPSTHAVVILIVLIVSPIHWMMISSLLFTRELCNLKDLSINPLSPLKTWGLQKWISVIGTFATTGSIIITFSSSIPIIMRWKYLSGRDLFWIFSMMPLLLAYWIYPYFKIRNMVREFKLQRMHFIKANISIAYDKWQALSAEGPDTVDPERLQEIERQMDRLNHYHGLFKVIDQSPEFFVDFYSILELAKVMGFPSLFALIVYFMRVF